MVGSKGLTALTVLYWLTCNGVASADGLLDGRVFKGMIGPVENPDLEDSLHFSDGHFWSEICTRCGFLPGEYTSERTDRGIVFRGVLESDSRGRFEYEGLARDDGTIDVSIQWERERWYWTSTRAIAFHGVDGGQQEPLTVDQVRMKMDGMDPGANPLCTRF